VLGIVIVDTRQRRRLVTWPIQVLTHLKLRHNLIGGDGAENLAGVLAQCAALTHHNLRDNLIGADGAESIARVD
jgi:Ran GTPase-activating protein (RanGAP) involved in mRNA processing and transport